MSNWGCIYVYDKWRICTLRCDKSYSDSSSFKTLENFISSYITENIREFE